MTYNITLNKGRLQAVNESEAIDFRPEDRMAIEEAIFFDAVPGERRVLKEGETYPKPDGFEIEIIDHYESTVNHVRQYSKYARLVPIKEQPYKCQDRCDWPNCTLEGCIINSDKSLTKEEAEKLSYPDGGGKWLVDGIWMHVHCDEYHMHSFKCLVPIKEQKQPFELAIEKAHERENIADILEKHYGKGNAINNCIHEIQKYFRK